MQSNHALTEGRTLTRNLRAMLADAAAFSLMVGLGETYVSAFVLALGMSEVAAGLVTTIPILAGAGLQLVSPWAIRQLQSHRRWVIACAGMQAFSLLILPAAIFTGGTGWLVFPAVTLYWAAGLAAGPAWNTWVEPLVPPAIRANFFAGRSRIAQFATLAGFVLGGIVLQSSQSSGLLYVFAALFIVAAIFRLISTGALVITSEAPNSHDELPHDGLRSLLRGGNGQPAKLLLYLLAVQLGVYVGAPYFTPYMLVQLGFSYGQFVTLIAIALVSRILILPVLGRYAHQVGSNRLLWLGGVAITPVSALWLVSGSFYWLAAVQFIAGFAWAAYELAMVLVLFESIPRHQRTSMLTLYNVGNAAAMVGGSLIGALILKLLGEAASTYLILFALSSIARAAALPLLRGIPEMKFEAVLPATRIVAVRPSAGAIQRPILPSLPEEEAVAAQTPDPAGRR